MTSQQQIAAFIARKGVTSCPPAEGKARSLRAMRKDAEHEAGREARGEDPEPPPEARAEAEAEHEHDSERHLRRMEHWGACRAAGVPLDVAWEEVDQID